MNGLSHRTTTKLGNLSIRFFENSRELIFRVMFLCVAVFSVSSVSSAQAVLQIKLNVVPSFDPGLFNVLLDNRPVAQDVAAGLTRMLEFHLPPAVYKVGQTAGRGTNLREYAVTFGGDCRPDGSVDLRSQPRLPRTCLITDARVAKAQITVAVSVGPANDPGLFNLQVDGVTMATAKGNGGSLSLAIASGPHIFSESGAPGTNAGDYVIVVGGACSVDGSITLAPNDNKTCSISNTKKPLPQLTVATSVDPPGDSGRFDIEIDRTVVGSSIANNGSFGPQTQTVGHHVVTQEGASGTNISQYATAFSGDCLPDGSIDLHLGDNKTCAIKSTRSTQPILPTDSVTGLAVGKTDGVGGVNNDGAATYAVPIWVPAGRAGMQPQLAFVYNSRNGNGPEGVGWTVTGQFEITRCRKTLLQDGDSKEITFTDGDEGDRYCMNGKRLVAVGGANGRNSVYGSEGTEYRTEEDMHAKIVSCEPDAYGPTYFRVYLADGRTLTLGTSTAVLEGQRNSISVANASLWNSSNWAPASYNTDLSQHVRYGWYLSRVEDRSGNYMTVDYTVAGSPTTGYQISPTALHYAGSTRNSAVLPMRHVTFLYEPRSDVEEHYISGLHLAQMQRLHSVQASYGAGSASNAISLRTYTLTYSSTSISGRSLLTRIQECDGASVCKRPTNFSWSPGDTAFTESVTPATSSGLTGLSIGDIDGDGLDDLLVGGATFYRGLGSNGLSPGVATNFAQPNTAPNSGPIWTRVIDMNIRGAADVAWLTSPRAPGSQPGLIPGSGFYVYKNQFYSWDSGGFAPLLDLAEQVYNAFPRPDYWLDLDGDGRPDALRPGPSVDVFGDASTGLPFNGTEGGSWEFRLNKGLGLPGAYTPSVVENNQPIGSYPQANSYGTAPRLRTLAMGLDLNGSGKSSLLVSGDSAAYLKAIAFSRGTLRTVATTFLGEEYGYCDPILVDLNGDGLADWVSVSPSGGALNVSINTGNGFAQPVQWSIPAPHNSSPSLQCDAHNDTGVRIIDFNQDGHQDLLLMGGFTSPANRSSQLLVLEWTGAGFSVVPLSIPTGAATNTGYLNPCGGGQSGVQRACGIGVWGLDWSNSQVMDLDGHGLADLLQVDSGTHKFHVWIRQGTRADLLTDAVDGFGVRDHFVYSPAIDSAVYQPGKTCAYPQLCIKRGMWLVAQHDLDVGSVPRTLRFAYQDGRIDVSGRGWIDFGKVTELDSARQTSTVTTYDNRTRLGTFYPCANQAIETETDVQLDPILHHILRLSQKCQVVAEHEGNVYFSYPSSRNASEWEGTRARPGLLSENTEKNLQDNFGNVTESESEVYDIDAGQPSGRSEKIHNRFAYDNFELSWLIGQLAHTEQRSVDRGGRSAISEAQYDYDPDTGLLSRIVREPSGQFAARPNQSDVYLETRIERNAYGLPTGIVFRGSGQVRRNGFTYDNAEFMLVQSVTNALGQTSNYVYEPSQALVASATDVNGVSTDYRYDGFGRLRFVYSPDGSNEQIHYVSDAQNRPARSVLQEGGTVFKTSFDGQRRPIVRQWLGFGGNWATTETVYDPLGRLVSKSLPHFVSATAVVTNLTYDGLDRVTVRQNPDGSSVTRKYQGLRTYVTDANSNQRYVDSDGAGRTKVSALLDSNLREVVTRFSYTPVDLVKKVVDAYGNVTSFEYDAIGRRTVLNDPDTGTTITHYDAFGGVKDQVDAGGRLATYVRDLLGRVVQMTTTDGVTTFAWDTSPHGIAKLATSTSPDGVVTSYSYDSLARLQEQQMQVAGSQYAFTYSFDPHGRPSTTTYPTIGGHNFKLQRNYTSEGELQSISDDSQQNVYWAASARNASEAITSENFGNGVTTNRGYDPELRLRSITTLSGTQPLQCISYGYDPSSNVTSRDMTQNDVCRTSQGPNFSASGESSPVDWVDRLASWNSVDSSWSVTYGYDDIGNLKQQAGPTVAIPPQMNYLYGENGAGVHAVTQVTSRSTILSYKYDKAGNQTIAPSRQVWFKSFNLPSRITSAQHDTTYKYDALGARVLKKDAITGQATVSINNIFEKRSGPGTSTRYVLYLPVDDRIVGEMSTGASGGPGQAFYFHNDALGSTETVSDESGSSILRFSYNPFGVQRSQVSSPVQPDIRLGFTGAEEDTEFGLINLVGRIYDPQIGRFLSPDPIVDDPFSGQLYNRYSYVLNGPLTFRDPSGFQAEAGEKDSADGGPIPGVCTGSCTMPDWVENFGAPTKAAAGAPATAPSSTTADDGPAHEPGTMDIIRDTYAKIPHALSQTHEEKVRDMAEANRRAGDSPEQARDRAEQALKDAGAIGSFLGALAAGPIVKGLGLLTVVPPARPPVIRVPSPPKLPIEGPVEGPQKWYGPFHRIPSDNEIELVEKSGLQGGRKGRNFLATPEPEVKAWEGPLPPEKLGYEFYTPIEPTPNGAPGFWVKWGADQAGVTTGLIQGEDAVFIPAVITRTVP